MNSYSDQNHYIEPKPSSRATERGLLATVRDDEEKNDYSSEEEED